MKPDILLKTDFLPHGDTLFDRLNREISWDDSMRSRKTASFGAPYNYSQMSYETKPFSPLFEPILNALENELGFRPNNCLANGYPDSEATMGFHFDSLDQLQSGTGVAIVSLGATRNLTFRRRDDKSVETSFALENNSLFYMPPAVQDEWLHGVLRSETEIGPRISLTFRRIS